MDRISINKDSNCVRVWEGGKNAKQTYFPVSQYGSMQAALTAAIEYEKSLPPENRKGKKKHRNYPNRNTSTGVAGVSMYRRKSVHLGYTASWTDSEGIKRSRQFSFIGYGSRAIDEAERWRLMMTSDALTDKNSVQD